MLFCTEVAMFIQPSLRPFGLILSARRLSFVFFFMVLSALAICSVGPLEAQAQKPQQQPDQAAPDSGGPTGDTGPIAVPRKKEAPDEPPPPAAPAEPKIKNPQELGAVSLRLEVPEVTVDVGVLL